MTSEPTDMTEPTTDPGELNIELVRLAHTYAELFSEWQRRNGQAFSQRARLHVLTDDELGSALDEAKADLAARPDGAR
jgi:hypothetical protein